MSSLFLFQIAALILLALGIFGLVYRRSLVGIFICVELILNGAGLSVVASSKLTAASDILGELSSLLIMGLAAAEATLILAILIVVLRRFGTVDSNTISTLGR